MASGPIKRDTIIFDGSKIYVTAGLSQNEACVLGEMLEKRRLSFKGMIDAAPNHHDGCLPFTSATIDRRPAMYACAINKALRACDYPLRVGNVRAYGYELR